MKKTIYTVYADGASSGNPGNGGWAFIVSDGKNVEEFGAGEKNVTNNQMEMKAFLEALSVLPDGADAKFFLDSKYVIEGSSKWIFGWMKNNWKTKTGDEVKNKELWQEIFGLLQGKNIEYTLVPGHSGVPANERVDVIAAGFAQGEFKNKKDANLYKGKLSEYSISLEFNPKEVTKKKKTKNTGKAYSYVSMVSGKILTHKTWAECEARVKGAKGAKFKKALDVEDEAQIKSQFASL